MAIIPAEEKVFMVSNSTNTTYSGSAALKAMQQWYTMQDVADSVQPYKVFTALLTQSGGNITGTILSGDYPYNLLNIGVTYEIVVNDGSADFTNVGAPNNIVGTFFIATGTIPNNWGTGTNQLNYNVGAPVATVLENTIGNVWLTYFDVGTYKCVSDSLFTENKTTISLDAYCQNGNVGALIANTTINNSTEFTIITSKGGLGDDFLQKNRIEIRVYN